MYIGGSNLRHWPNQISDIDPTSKKEKSKGKLHTSLNNVLFYVLKKILFYFITSNKYISNLEVGNLNNYHLNKKW